MTTSSAPSSPYLNTWTSSVSNLPVVKQQPSQVKASLTVTALPGPITSSLSFTSVSSCFIFSSNSSLTSTTSSIDGYSTPKAKLDPVPPTPTLNQIETLTQIQDIPSLSPLSAMGKRKRLDLDDHLSSVMACPVATKRRVSGNHYVRKGQWTSTEERLTRLLIEAFEEGSLPIYTGIRLRGYLAVQLQCDPMRVSKKLCTGTIYGKKVPRNYGQKKFKLQKEAVRNTKEAAARFDELERLTKALWSEARMSKPTFLTLSSTCNFTKRREAALSNVTTSCSSLSTFKSKKQKMFPVIYLNLSKSKRYLNKKDSDDDSSSEVVSPCKDSESDGELIKLDGESLQAAYDLLALCSLQGSSSKDRNKEICLAAHCQEHDLSTNTFSKVEIHEDKRTTHFETPGNKR